MVLGRVAVSDERGTPALILHKMRGPFSSHASGPPGGPLAREGSDNTAGLCHRSGDGASVTVKVVHLGRSTFHAVSGRGDRYENKI